MFIDTIEGDLITLFKEGKGHLIHGCNCFHIMGGGIAAHIAKTFPNALEVDKMTNYGDKSKLGLYSVWWHRVGFDLMYGINMYTQFNPGPDAQYKAIHDGFVRLNANFKGLEKPFLVPKIGCGIGGLTWGNVSEIINNVTPDIDLIHVEYKG